MTIESILRQKGTAVVTIAPEANIKNAADWLRAKNVGALLVMNGDAIVGIISTGSSWLRSCRAQKP
jgi:CBS domain-containing protein